jgi:hypothetical protein
MYKIFLNVIREGKLLGEIKGILDEVQIMLQIQEQQKRVLKTFSKHVARLLGVIEPPLEPVKGKQPSEDPKFTTFRIADPAENTMLHVRELAESVDDHISELANLEGRAFQISTAVSVPYAFACNASVFC